MYRNSKAHRESGNALVVVLLVLVVAAIGGLAFMSGKVNLGQKDSSGVASLASEPASGQQNASQQSAAAATDGEPAPEPMKIEEGNPVVAKLNGSDITRLDILNYMQNLPANLRQLPADQLFPLAQQQFVTAKIIEAKAATASVSGEEEYQKQLEVAKKQIQRNVFMQKEVEKRLSDARVKSEYDEYVKNFPEVEEVKARHILVDDEAVAKDLIKKLDEGAVFEELAKENSKDLTAQNGGDLGYFAAAHVVPEFSEAAFKMKNGAYTGKAVKSQFGYHVIQVEDKRKRPPAEFEVAKPFIEGQVRRKILDEIVQEWVAQADVEQFDVNGKPIEPAAGN